jgi:hypothetical protein
MPISYILAFSGVSHSINGDAGDFDEKVAVNSQQVLKLEDAVFLDDNAKRGRTNDRPARWLARSEGLADAVLASYWRSGGSGGRGVCPGQAEWTCTSIASMYRPVAVLDCLVDAQIAL